MRAIECNGSRYVFWWKGREAQPEEAAGLGFTASSTLTFVSHSAAAMFLRQFRGSLPAMLRERPAGFRGSDGAAVDEAARMLCVGSLCVLRRWREPQDQRGSGGGGAKPAAAPRREAAIWRDSAEEPTFGALHDAADQAETLRCAAETGVPFCAECERLKREAQQQEEPAAEEEYA